MSIEQLANQVTIMGILNVTPDSFSDGGNYNEVEAALVQVEKLLADGATVIDVGGESTRPGASFVSEEDEIARVVPIIRAIKENYECLVSIDTYKTGTARAALEAGADILNDVWAGLYDGEMLALAAEYKVPIILMHNQKEESYADVVGEVRNFITERAQAALDAGIATDKIWLIQALVFLRISNIIWTSCKAWTRLLPLVILFYLEYLVSVWWIICSGAMAYRLIGIKLRQLCLPGQFKKVAKWSVSTMSLPTVTSLTFGTN